MLGLNLGHLKVILPVYVKQNLLLKHNHKEFLFYKKETKDVYGQNSITLYREFVAKSRREKEKLISLQRQEYRQGDDRLHKVRAK